MNQLRYVSLKEIENKPKARSVKVGYSGHGSMSIEPSAGFVVTPSSYNLVADAPEQAFEVMVSRTSEATADGCFLTFTYAGQAENHYLRIPA